MDTITIIINELKLQHKTQKDLMDFLGIHPNVFTNWKAGRAKSYTKYIYQIAAFLDVSPEYLRGETQQKSPPLLASCRIMIHFEDENYKVIYQKFVGRNGKKI